ncbi:hypothetical protein HMPREF0063_11898 [Aeromicrobium marinum DSM 15272]|uniref:Uncharacterized protein n=1 Tax=Aeromicrobium marinum DSM 15272 TaxID=585531 RepID=E2SDW2_9ACTN|nr:hypothetical protein [Aeromicrobium marinum]EFQ82689.1 hypothetical protein HMPREF0063_11898 [Aeromicrobium marinum DSM 15272]
MFTTTPNLVLLTLFCGGVVGAALAGAVLAAGCELIDREKETRRG